MVHRVTSFFVLVLVIAGCGPGSSSMPADLCVNRVLNAVLTVDTDDPRMMWATNAAGIELQIRLPGGYGVTPEDEIVNADGQVIGTSGDRVVGGCADLLQDVLLVTEADIRREP